MLTRHCVMVVGPTGGGKSVVIDTLARAQTALGFPTKLYPINPKAQTVNELYGIPFSSFYFIFFNFSKKACWIQIRVIGLTDCFQMFSEILTNPNPRIRKI